MLALVITNCTARKRSAQGDLLSFGALPRGPLPEMACAWADQLKSKVPSIKAEDLYVGRSINEARRAAEHAGTNLRIISAGLGLVSSGDLVTPYDATISGSSASNILQKSNGSRPSSSEWWALLSTALGTPYPLTRLVMESQRDSIVILSLSRPYLDMVQTDLTSIPRAARRQLRILSHGDNSDLCGLMQPCLVRYDDRFDGPDSPNPGTKADFLQRAAVHFVTEILTRSETATCQEHQSLVEKCLSSMRRPKRPKRRRATDDQVVEFIRQNIHHADGQSSKMLRYLRDELLISCEQGRFKNLFYRATTGSSIS